MDKRYNFDVTLTITADSMGEAEKNAQSWLTNVKDTMGHCPFSCEITMDPNADLDYEDDEEEEEIDSDD